MYVPEQGERQCLPQRSNSGLVAIRIYRPFFPPAELQIRQEKGLICASAAILAVDDPRPNIGSGSATLNALISVTECLAARQGHKVGTN